MNFAFMTLFSAIPLTLLVYGLSYAMYSYALYKMADNTGVKPASLAWVPGLRLYTLGQLADRYNASIGKRSAYRFILPGLRLLVIPLLFATAVLVFLSYLTGFGVDGLIVVLGTVTASMVAFVSRVLEMLCYYKTFCDFEPEYSVLYLILSILGLEWVALFLCRQNVPVGIAGRCRPRQPRYHEG